MSNLHTIRDAQSERDQLLKRMKLNEQKQLDKLEIMSRNSIYSGKYLDAKFDLDRLDTSWKQMNERRKELDKILYSSGSHAATN